ncbi:IS3 family transposase, partial [Lactiplantibacillus paraplantarum]|uniref:IS3 family transposase n=1 Tax=Lactiplantibacillus paraplantarum TaxID=60520 RepID=UPI002072CCDB
NAAMESFFHLMKAEMMDEHFENSESLAQAMTEWIEFYNNRRMTYTPKVKVKALALEVFFMTKISKETKLRALTEYFAGQGSSL